MGYIILVLFIFFVILNKNLGDIRVKLFILVTFFSLHFNLAQVPIIGIDFSEMFLILYLVVSILKSNLLISSPKKTIYSLILLITILIGFFTLISNPPNKLVVGPTGSWDKVLYGIEQMKTPTFNLENVKRFFRVFLYIFLIFEFSKIKLEGKKIIINTIVKIALIISFLGIIESLTTNIFGYNYFRNLITEIFFRDYKTIFRGNLYAVSVFNGEPSSFSLGMLPALMFISSGMYKGNKSNWIFFNSYFIFFVIFSVLIISSSLAGFSISCLMLFLFLLNKQISIKNKRKLLFLIFILIIIMFWVFLNYYFIRFFGIFGNQYIGSEHIRTTSIKEAINWFLDRPIFGYGLGSVNCYGALPALLSSVGIFGTIFWLLFTFNFDIRQNQNWFKILVIIIILSFTGNIGTIYGITPILLGVSLENVNGG